jgi:hypothetical protein
MQGWHTTFLGMRGLPRDISDFEMKAFFTFDGAERDAINARRGDSHKLGLALHIGFLRMSGRLLGAFRVIPVALWRHLGNELGIAAPEVASLRAMYERGRTLFDHQQVACTVLGFQWMSEHQRRSLVRELRDEVARCADRDQLLVRARRCCVRRFWLTTLSRTLSGTSCAGCSIGARLLTPSSAPFIPAGYG